MSKTIKDNFDFRANAPLDKRFSQENSNVELPYQGMFKFNPSDKKYYKYVDNVYIDFFKDINDTITSINTKNDNYKIVNIRNFGAIGDGIFDDTTAIKNAIDYVKNNSSYGTIFFPTGTYLISDTLDISREKITLKGENSRTYIVFNPTSMKDCFVCDGTNSYVGNVIIDGLNFNPAINLTGGAMIHFINTSMCVVKNCNFNIDANMTFYGNHGVLCEKTIGTIIRDNNFQHFMGNAIFVQSNDMTKACIDHFIYNNYIRDGNVGIIFLNNCNGIFIKHNTLYLNSSNLYLDGLTSNAMASIMIDSNDIDSATNKGTVMNNLTAFQFNNNWVANSSNYSITCSKIAGGTFNNNQIYSKNQGSVNFGISLFSSNAVTINGNLFSGGDGGILLAKDATLNTVCNGISIVGNVIEYLTSAIDLWAGTNGVSVGLNTFMNCTAGIGSSGNSQNLVNVNNNSITI